jgi:biopolymer transport protein ExbD
MSMSLGGSRKGKKRQTPDINVTPLVDVMLVLLIIFMITVQATRETIPIELPQAPGSPEDQAKAGNEIAINENSKVQYSGRVLDLQQVPSELPRMLKGKEKDAFTLSAHKKLPYEVVVKVIAAIRTAGIETVYVAVEGE